MVRITFRREGTGDETVVDAPVGQSLMSAAKAQQVDGIEAICGGAMVCGTCHVYIDPAWFDRIPAPKSGELDMVDCGADPRPTSRLACQIVVTPELDGLIVATPVSQL